MSEASQKNPTNTKKPSNTGLSIVSKIKFFNGRDDRIRTYDLIKYEPDLATIIRKLETIFSIITVTHLQINQMIDAGIQSLNSTPGFILYNSAKTPILPTPISISAKKYAPPKT